MSAVAYNNLSDQELVDLLNRSDHAAFRAIHDRYYGALYTHAYKRFPYREDVRDAIQELFTWLWDNREYIERDTGLEAYLYTAVRNRMFKIYRHQKVQTQYMDSLQEFIERGEFTTDMQVSEKELIDLVKKEVAALPQKMKEIFELSRNEGLSHNEIAIVLNLSPHTVRAQIRNALRILRGKLGPHIFFIFFL